MIPEPTMYPSWKDWAHALASALEGEADEREPVRLPSYTVSTLPNAAEAGLMIFVLDEVGGETPAYSSGGVWKRTSDGATVS